ncbi:hypothetical protein [Methanolobus profundi]|uniref:Uncharacterized protein n=1 Tax=Methanolobus profundi TaxID=487685 RepID=A0A1I4TJA3_9EURY|nr:hypothetical protein [Methanolobus profundi]SFM76858.1 hypothetical protein SAMN04488696_2298 [Methanolobus profundi]
MSSTDLVKYGSRPEMLFRVSLNPDGNTYQKEISLVFPKYVSADLPHYKDDFMPKAHDNTSDGCQWHFSIED